MLPYLLIHYLRNNRGCDSVFLGQFNRGSAAGRISRTYGDNLDVGQPCSARPLTLSAPSPLLPICDVLDLRARVDMSGVAAPTMVAGVIPLRSLGEVLPMVQFPRYNVRLTIPAAVPKMTVAMPLAPSKPRPTFARVAPINLGPEVLGSTGEDSTARVAGSTAIQTEALSNDVGPRCKCRAALKTGTLNTHRKTLPFGVIPPAVHGRAGAFACPNYTPAGGF